MNCIHFLYANLFLQLKQAKTKNSFGSIPGLQRFTVIALLLAFLLFSVQILVAQSGNDKGNVGANDLVVSLPNIAPFAFIENSQNKGIFVNLVDAMDKFYQNKGVEINGKIQKGRIILSGIFPFQRSIYNITNGIADFHIPLLVNPLINIEDMEKLEKFNYSSAILLYVGFAVYANKDFAGEIHAFESQIGKKLPELSTNAEYARFDEFIQQKKRNIGVDRAHTNFYKFKTTPMNENSTGLMLVANNRLDAYIHNMNECDVEIANLKIDTSNMEKIYYHRFEVHMIIPVGEKNKQTDQVISQIIWGLQGRKAADVPLKNFAYSGNNKEVPDNSYQQSAAFKKSEYYKIVSMVYDPVFTGKMP